jgi:hypothetical protein
VDLRRTIARSIRESELESSVMDLARVLGWRRAHFRPAMLPSGKWATHMSGDVGFPDLVLARRGALIVAELKRSQGRPTPDQLAWLDVLGSVPGVTAALWRTEDWLSGEIEAVLRSAGAAH